jgi:hypothetical protein
MCLYANGFLKGVDREHLTIPDPPIGLFASLDHTINLQFKERFNEDKGLFITFHDGHCLCQYKDWRTLVAYANSIRQENNLDEIPVMLFGTGVDYEELEEGDFDYILDKIDGELIQGFVLTIKIVTSRRLQASLGKQVEFHYKSGKIAKGKLESYQEEEDYGILATKGGEIYFSSRELKDVIRIIDS